ncbi:hypothetical protein FQA39_LY04945 [Lamprigera yunnana]|nr:hypothetical protein FQA39_LY04945 [Lamprigera yunnana]
MISNNILYGPTPIVPISSDSIGWRFYNHFKNNPQKIAFSDGVTNAVIRYEEILKQSCLIALKLKKMGYTKGDVVGICCENIPEFWYIVFGSLYIGLTVTTFNPHYKLDEMNHCINISKPNIMFCSKIALKSLPEVKFSMTIVTVDAQNLEKRFKSLQNFISHQTLSDDAMYQFENVSVDINKDIAFILYSSGTTGFPKGVCLTHKNANAVLVYVKDPRYAEQNTGDVVTGVLPFFHAAGLFSTIANLIIHREIVILKSFDQKLFLKILQDKKVKQLSTVPFVINFLANNSLVDKLNLKTFWESYGMTETSFVTISSRLNTVKFGSSGQLVPYMSAKIVNPSSGKSLRAMEVGELCVRGPLVMKEYKNDLTATKDAIDKDGWLRTGDLAYFDDESFIFIVGRLKEIIKYKGFQVSPTELEAILLSNPKVADVAVTSLSDDKVGQLPLALVVKAPNSKLTELEVEEFVEKRVSSQKRLRGGVIFVNEIPKTESDPARLSNAEFIKLFRVNKDIVTYLVDALHPFITPSKRISDIGIQIKSDGVTNAVIRYEEVLKQSCLIALKLKKMGYTKGDVVGICCENIPEFWYIVFGSLYIGLTVTTFNPHYKLDEMNHCINISKPNIVFCSKIALKSLSEVKFSMTIVTVDAQNLEKRFKSLQNFISHQTLNDDAMYQFENISVDINKDIAFILYSSGTTGFPKGVCLTHKNANAALVYVKDPRYAERNTGDVVTGVLPFFHVAGFFSTITNLIIHREIVILKSFDRKLFLKILQDKKVKQLSTVPFVINFLANNSLVDNYQLSLEVVTIGGDRVDKDVAELLMKRFNLKTFWESYGTTETSFVTISPRLNTVKFGSCGQLVPYMSAKIVNPSSGESLRAMEVGELWVRGPLVMKEYKNDLTATNDAIDKDGWLRTGDLAYFDDESFIFIIGRLKEIIKYKGFQVSPTELEAILLSNPKVADVAVTSLSDDKVGQLPLALVVKAPNSKLTELEVEEFVEKRVSSQKRLRGGVIFVNEIPRTGSGKIVRHKLKQFLKNKLFGSASVYIISSIKKSCTMIIDNIIHGPKPLVPISNDSLGLQLYNLFNNNPHRVAFSDPITTAKITCKEVLKQSSLIGSKLIKMNFEKGTVVGICCENTPEFWYILFGSFYAGLVVTAFNPRYKSSEIEHCMNVSNPKIIFCSKIALSSLLKIRRGLKTVVVDVPTSQDEYDSLHDFTLDQGFDAYTLQKMILLNRYAETALILYSSGTTGLPKGVCLTHKNISALISYSRDPRYRQRYLGDTIVGVLPFFHSAGFFIAFLNLVMQKEVVIFKSFDRELFLKVLQDKKVKVIQTIPVLLHFLAKSPLVDKYEFSLETITFAAGRITDEVANLLVRRLKLPTFWQEYGMTELSFGVVSQAINNNKYGSSGQLFPFMSAKVVDPKTGKTLKPMEVGELCFKGPLVMKEYMNNPTATKDTIDEDEWLHSGDLGYFDNEEYLYIVDRLKEIIKYKGYQVSPAELEAVLISNPKIADAAVVGLPNDEVGELPLAFVVKAPNSDITELEVQKFVENKVCSHKRLRGGVLFVNEIAKTPTGKIQRPKLREMLRSKL